MQLSLVGLIVCAVLLVWDWRINGRLVIALMASMAFGATALVSLTSLGGASPIIFTLFALLIIFVTIFRRHVLKDLTDLFKAHPAAAMAVAMLIAYTLASAYLLPRIFAGEVIVFAVNRTSEGGAVEAAMLMPASYNLTQAGYLSISACMFVGVSIILRRENSFRIIKLGFYAWAALVALSGGIDLAAKLVGLDDVLEPLRTANYAMMTSTDHALAGFYRVSGLFAESSAYGAAAMACLAFCASYWRYTGRTSALLLTLMLLAMVVLSTSSTAYVSLLACSLLFLLAAWAPLASGRLRRVDLLALAFALMLAASIMAAFLVRPDLFDPIARLIEVSILNKATSDSALERSTWNAYALEGLVQTYGLGVGIGSTRTSSWLVAVISHLGIFGTAMIAYLLFLLARGVRESAAPKQYRERIAIAQSARFSAIAWLLSASVSSPSPDPGIVFFVALASVLECSRLLRSEQSAARPAQAGGLAPAQA